ncbi:MAG: DUF1587 domain-containing protein, partial [Caulobacteraceae bacterium]|nr:DUF1587 domain-containing protein [Caulobacteraceae bacterium]
MEGRLIEAARGRVVAALAARFRNLDLAEEAFSEAAASAVVAWRRECPDDPAGWLWRTAYRKALDALARAETRRKAIHDAPPPQPTPEDILLDSDQPIPDKRLRLIFVCCHPALAPDARIAGFDKVAGALDLSLAHVSAYAAAAEVALTAAIATRSTPPPVFKACHKPAGLFKLKQQVIEGNSVLLKNGQPDPAMPLLNAFPDRKGRVPEIRERDPEIWKPRQKLYDDQKLGASDDSVGILMENMPGRETAVDIAVLYPGRYRMRLSTWGFRWNKGKVEQAESLQAAVLRA